MTDDVGADAQYRHRENNSRCQYEDDSVTPVHRQDAGITADILQQNVRRAPTSKGRTNSCDRRNGDEQTILVRPQRTCYRYEVASLQSQTEHLAECQGCTLSGQLAFRPGYNPGFQMLRHCSMCNH